MAARKSCTHLTWAEAKGKVGGSGGAGGKKKVVQKKMDHADRLAQKIIAKNGASQGLVTKKDLARKARRDEEKAASAEARRAEEREKERQAQVVKPFEQAQERMSELARKQQQEDSGGAAKTADMDLSGMRSVAQCREMQLDEVAALEAIFAETDEFLISDASDPEGLRQKIEEWQMDEENEGLLRSVVRHPPTDYVLQLTIDGDVDGNDLAASLLLRVTLPPLYPLDETTVPIFEVAFFLATDREAVCSADKPLVSLGHLDEGKLKKALADESRQILPDPSVYEVAVTWLAEHLFEFVTMNIHAQQKS